MPARKIPKSYRNVTGVLSTSKSESLVSFESPLERDLILILDFDLNVASIEEQPVTIEYFDSDGKLRTYTPDLLVHYRKDILPAKEMPALLCEVKPRENLFKNWKTFKPKFKAAIRFAKERGWVFRILTEAEIRTPHLENVRFLRAYRNIETHSDHERLLLDALYDLRETTPEDLLMVSSWDKWRRAQFLPCLWQLISRREIGADLNLPINMKSRIWTMDVPI